MTPQARSLELWRRKGFLVSSVERRKRFPQRGKQPCPTCGAMKMVDVAVDLWNVFDLIAIGHRVMFIQVTTAANHADRRNKIFASAEAKICVLHGHVVVVQSWRKKDGRWIATDEIIKASDFPQNLANSAVELYSQQLKSHADPVDDLFATSPIAAKVGAEEDW